MISERKKIKKKGGENRTVTLSSEGLSATVRILSLPRVGSYTLGMDFLFRLLVAGTRVEI